MSDELNVGTFLKSPEASKDYPIDWAPYLQPSETVVSVVWSVDPAGLTIGAGAYAPAIDSDGKGVVVWLQGGTAGQSYVVSCVATTSNVPPRIDKRTITINVEGALVSFVPPVISVVGFGAVEGGSGDNTTPFQSALTTAGLGGGTVMVPPGRWRLNSGLTVPAGVTLTGSSLGMSLGGRVFNPAIPLGAQLEIYGTGKFITTGQAATVENLGFYYPTQVTNSDPSLVVFDYTLSQPANAHWCTFRNLYAINPYRLLEVRANGSTVENIGGHPISRGITLGRIADVARIHNIHFNPVANFSTGATLLAWIQTNGVAMVVDGPEEFGVRQFFAYGYGDGISIWDEDADGFRGVYGSWLGGGTDICDRGIRVREPNGLTARGFSVFGVGIVPNGASAHAIEFTDTHIAASMDERPSIDCYGCRFWNTSDRVAVLATGSYGVLKIFGGSARDFANAAFFAQSATSILHLDHVAMPTPGVARTAGAGTIVDANPINL